jgi:prophage endopeptidase
MTSIQRTAIAVVLTLLVVFGIYKWGYGRGWGDRDAEMQVQIAAKNEHARQLEQEAAKAVAEKDAELRKANDVINKKQTDLNAAIRAGRVRLPTSCPQASASATIALGDRNQAPSQPDRAPDQAAGGSTPEPTESERETLRLIAEIAAEGDRAINQLNACVDAYDKMRDIINGQR